jgi:hypothetical protein
MAKEKTPTFYYIIFGFAALLLLFALIEVNFNLCGSFLGQNGAAAGPGWTVLEVIFLFIAGGLVYFGNESKRGIEPGWVIGAGVMVVLAICAAAGFNFAIA